MTSQRAPSVCERQGMQTVVPVLEISRMGCKPKGLNPSADFVFARNPYWRHVDVRGDDECWPWVGFHTLGGYGSTTVNGRARAAHRVMWEALHGPIAVGLVICHRCDNPPCINPRHLFIGTHADNHADRNRKGRQARGERMGAAKLTDNKVREARRLHAAGETYHALGQRFGVDRKAIERAVKGLSWSHVV